MAEIKTYTPPEGVYGPVLGRDIPEGWEWLNAGYVDGDDAPQGWLQTSPAVTPLGERLFWVRPRTVKIGDRFRVGNRTYVVWAIDGGWIAYRYDDGLPPGDSPGLRPLSDTYSHERLT